MDILGDMRVCCSIALKSEVLADRNFFCCSILIASVRDLIRQLRGPQIMEVLRECIKAAGDKFRVPVLDMKLGGCSGPACKEGCGKP